MSPALIALRDELLAAQSLLIPQIEGLHDFARLNLKPDSVPVVKATTADFERRLGLLTKALESLTALSNDGYPAVDQRDVLGTIYADLQENVSTLQAAFAKFAPVAEATEATILAGDPVPKA